MLVQDATKAFPRVSAVVGHGYRRIVAVLGQVVKDHKIFVCWRASEHFLCATRGPWWVLRQTMPTRTHAPSKSHQVHLHPNAHRVNFMGCFFRKHPQDQEFFVFSPERARSCGAEITYLDEQGTAQRFLESNEDPSPWFQTGTQIKVLYQLIGKYGQSEGKLNPFTALWGCSIVFAATGTPFSSLGFFLLHDAIKPNTKSVKSKQ